MASQDGQRQISRDTRNDGEDMTRLILRRELREYRGFDEQRTGDHRRSQDTGILHNGEAREQFRKFVHHLVRDG